MPSARVLRRTGSARSNHHGIGVTPWLQPEGCVPEVRSSHTRSDNAEWRNFIFVSFAYFVVPIASFSVTRRNGLQRRSHFSVAFWIALLAWCILAPELTSAADQEISGRLPNSTSTSSSTNAPARSDKLTTLPDLSSAPLTDENHQRGQFLAHAVCSTCHLFPEPGLLTKSDWISGALRTMAPFLGVAHVNLEKRPDGKLLKQAGVFPDDPMLSETDWNAILEFYADAAPEELARPPKIESSTRIFSVHPLLRSPAAPCTSLLQIDGNNHRFFVGDAQTRTLKLVALNGTILRECQMDSGPVALFRQGATLEVTLIGRILPSDELAGQIWELNENTTGWSVTKLIRGLRRPVHAAPISLDRAGRSGLIVSCYGNRLGKLALFDRGPTGKWDENVIADGAGTLRAIPYDWDGDGLADLTVLRAQGREGADIYLKKGGTEFEQHILWNDPPAYGNVSFELVDFDRDGRPELLVVNGDAGDFNCGPKPYHGIRIFRIDKQLKAELKFQFNVGGAYCARAADFDMDGKIDIALVSFFPDYEHAPDQAFVYLHNEGDWKFTPHIIPGLNQGRWILLDAGDLDGDGDPDLLLGSFALGPATIPIPIELKASWEKERLAVVWLENLTRKGKPAQ